MKTKSGSLKSGFIIVSLIVVVFVSIKVSLLQFRSPDVVSVNSETRQFSAERAFEYLREFAVAPHPLGSQEHERVKNYLMTTLKELGVEPVLQTVQGTFSAWGSEYKGKVENIVARIPGEDSSKAIMIASHYDSEVNSPGAADDRSGVAAILETVRILVSSPPLKNDVIILITDGEEPGSLGAQVFVREHPWAKEVGIALNFEARGSEGPSVLFEASEGNDQLISEFVKGAPNAIAHSFLYDLYKILPNDTDLTIFKQAGMHGLNFAFFEDYNNYHTPGDSVENLSLNSLQHHGEYMLNLVTHFGNLNLVEKEKGNRLYFNVFGKKVVTYAESLVTPIMIMILIAYVFTHIYGYKRKLLSLPGISAGFLVFLMAIFLSFALGYCLYYLLSAIFVGKIWIITTVFKFSNPFFIGFLFLNFFIFTLIYQFAVRKINLTNLMMGALLGWLLLLIITSILYKGSSYIFAWPLLLGLINLNLLMSLKKTNTFMQYGITIGCLITVLTFTAPILYLVYTLSTIEYASFLLAFSTLLGAFTIPVLSIKKSKFWYSVPMAFFTSGLLFFIGSGIFLQVQNL